ncbi:MAG: hypothetical protein J6C80_02310 [Flavobacteriales bacterium]|nr:hypothetical protein [Flavobacteriales bacterium]
MKKILTLLFTIVAIITLSAQSNTKHLAFPHFVEGVVYFKDGGRLDAKLNYSLIWDKLLFMENGEIMRVNNAEKISHAVLGGQVFIPVGEVFYQVIREGDDGLYYQYHGKLIPAGAPSLYGTTSQTSGALSLAEIGVVATKLEMPADYKVQVENKYMWYRNGKYTPFTSVKEICNAFPGHDKEIKAFIKDNKIRLRSHQEYLDVLDFCVSIR